MLNADKSTDRIASHIIRQIESLGYVVIVQRAVNSVEMRATDNATPPQVHISRIDDTGPDAKYKAACGLAQAVGVELEDG